MKSVESVVVELMNLDYVDAILEEAIENIISTYVKECSKKNRQNFVKISLGVPCYFTINTGIFDL
jgi:hypothetical protein